MREGDTPAAQAGPRPDTGPRPPLLIVMNAGSGSGDKHSAYEAAHAVLEELRYPHTLHMPEPGEDLATLCDRVARKAAADGGALVAAGGDGTVNTAANAARRHGVPLGLLPFGTFNYFGRQQGIPTDPADAARALATGTSRPIDAGEVNGRLFLNHASFGVYTRVVRHRERAKQRFGRYRAVAALSGMSVVLQQPPVFSIRTVADGAASVQQTSSVVVACNALQLEQLGLDAAGCARAGTLAILLLRPTSFWDRLRLLLRTPLKQLDADACLSSFCATDLEVESRRRTIEAVIDGETVDLRPPLMFRAVPAAVTLIGAN